MRERLTFLGLIYTPRTPATARRSNGGSPCTLRQHMNRTTQGTPRYALRPTTICTPRMETRLLSFPVTHPTNTIDLVAATESIFYAQQNTLHALRISYMQAHVIRLRFVVCASHSAAHDTRSSFFLLACALRRLCNPGRQADVVPTLNHSMLLLHLPRESRLAPQRVIINQPDVRQT